MHNVEQIRSTRINMLAYLYARVINLFSITESIFYIVEVVDWCGMRVCDVMVMVMQ